MAELLAVGTSETPSADFTIPAGGRALLSLKAATSGFVPINARAVVRRKDAAAVYTVIGRMDRDQPAIAVDNPGSEAMVCHVMRIGGENFGVDRS